MTENLFNINLKCPNHQKEIIQNCCTFNSCSRAPFSCPVCPEVHSEHFNSIIPFSEWINKVSKALEDSIRVQRLFKEDTWDQVLKWCEDDEMHLHKVESHCNAQKQLITEDLNVIKRIFHDKCLEIQLFMDSQLDDFILRYKEAFKSAKSAIDENYISIKCFYPYQNPNNLFIKLQQSSQEETKEFVHQIKKMISRTQGKQIEQEQQNLRLIADRITEMTCSLPVYQFSEGIDILCSGLAEKIQDNMKSKLLLNSLPSINNNNREKDREILIEREKENVSTRNKSTSKTRVLQKQHSLPSENCSRSKSPRKITGNYQSNPQQPHTIAHHNKSLFLNQSLTSLQSQDISLKPLKKYQLDFQVSAISVVNETLFALTCSNDPYLRIFDTGQKRIHTLQAHSNPIIGIQKSFSGEGQLSQSILGQWNGPKSTPQKASFLFTLSNDQLIIWTFEGCQSVPHIYSKYTHNGNVSQMCHLQDNTNIVLGDKDGGIEVYNYQCQKIQQVCMKGKHTKQITAILLVKRLDKFVVGSLDSNISIWRLLYNLHSQNAQFESAYCEQIVQFPQLGQINTLSLISGNSNLLLVGTLEGSMKIVNLLNSVVLMETESIKNSAGVVDTLVCEDINPKKQGTYESICAIGLGQGSKNLRFWRVLHREQNWTQNEVKIDVALSQGENMCKSKLQFVYMLHNSSNPLILITNETNKELLVYEIVSKQ